MEGEGGTVEAPRPMTKAELDRRISQAWLALEQTIGQGEPQQLLTAGPGGWRVNVRAWHDQQVSLLARVRESG